MRHMWSVIGTLVLLLAMAAVGLASQTPAEITEKASPKLNDEPANAPAASGSFTGLNELDEVIGDTITVGTTWRDMQHNATLGHMLFAQDAGDGNTMLGFTWTYRAGPNETSQTYYREGIRAADGTVTLQPADGGVIVNNNGFSAYQVINADDQNNPVITYHRGPASGDDYFSAHSYPNAFIPFFFDTYDIPGIEVITMWPHTGMAPYEGNWYAHSMLNQYTDGNLFEDGLYYNRSLWDPVSLSFTNATPGDDEQVLITQDAINLSNAVAVSDDGSHVAIAQTIYRNTAFDDAPPTGDPDTQFNNDVLYWESTQGGDDWDSFSLDDAVNVTDFIPADPSLLPDTLAANRDTMRAHTYINMAYDGMNRLHMSYTTNDFYWYTNSAFRMNRLWYWNNEMQYHVQIADGTQHVVNLGTVTTTFEEYVDNSMLYFDDDTGVLWCAFVQYGLPSDTLANGDPYDASDGNSTQGFAIKATDVFVTASPDMGRHWAKPVNVTNTINMGTGLGPYETVSEREMTMARDNDGDYLHIFYTRDYDPGVAVPGGDGAEGEPTENHVMYHAVPKAELINMFDANAEWVVNYPMHVDGSGYWEPGNGYPEGNDSDTEWPPEEDDYIYPTEGFMSYVPDDNVDGGNNTLQPDQFELKQNYPNPFNPSTNIEFTLNAPGKVKLAVYDVLGREVATLVNRGMTAGNHNVSFYAGDLSSGVYFYKLTSGDVSTVRKMVLMK